MRWKSQAVFSSLPGGVLASLKHSFQLLDGDGNNELDFGEFCIAMRLKQTTLARKLFQMYDQSGDGQIQMHEFIAGAARKPPHCSCPCSARARAAKPRMWLRFTLDEHCADCL
jgi:hypothetical protein